MSTTAQQTAPFFVAGGTLSADATSYVERSADTILFAGLSAGKFCYVLNSRQMGKSSICVRTMRLLAAGGACTAFVDLTKIGGKNVTPEQWYAGIAMEIGRSLDMRTEILSYWKENSHVSPVQRLFGSLREVVLEKVQGPVAVFFDEIDATRSLSFSADEFFAAIRECYNRRVHDETYKRLTFCLLGVAVPSDLINAPTSTPFNVGERIYLRDFTLDEARVLAAGLGENRDAQQLLERAFYWTGGHPYLTQSLCAAIAADPSIRTREDVDALVKRDLFEPKARETNINLADVANRALHAGDLEEDPEKFRADLLSAYERAWNGKPLADDESNRVDALLKLSGIMRSEGNQLKVRNRIYHHVFDKTWIRENMPGQELRRQKRAFYLGVLRAGGGAIAVISVVTVLAIAYARAAGEARQQRDAVVSLNRELDLQLYLARVGLMRQAWENSRLDELRSLLLKTGTSKSRGWEWDFWNRAANASIGRGDVPVDSKSTIGVSPDHRFAAVVDSHGVPWLTDGNKVTRIPSSEPLKLATPDNGAKAVAGISKSNTAVVIDAKSGRVLWSSRKISKPNGVVFSPDGQTIAISSGTWQVAGEMQVWDWRNNRPIGHIAQPKTAYFTPEFSRDGRQVLIATQGWGKTRGAWLFDVAAGRTVTSYATDDTTWCCAFSSSGEQVYTGDIRRRLMAWDRKSGKVLASQLFPASIDFLGSYSGGDHFIAHLIDGDTLVLNPDGNVALRIPSTVDCWMSPGGYAQVIRADGIDTSLETYDLERSPMSQSGNSSSSTQAPASQSPDGSTIWVGLDANAIEVFDRKTLARTHRIPMNVQQVAVSAGPYAVAADFEIGNKIWLIDTRSFTASGFKGDAVAMPGDRFAPIFQLDPSGRRLLSTDKNGRAGLWSVPDGKLIAILDAGDGPALAATTSPDGTQVLVCSKDGTRIFAVEDGRRLASWRFDAGSPMSMAVSKDGTLLAFGYASGHIKVFDVRSQGLVVDIAAYRGSVASLEFNRSGDRLLAAGDAQAKLFHLPTGAEVLRLDHPNDDYSAAFSPNEDAIITAGWFASPTVWPRYAGALGRTIDAKPRAAQEGHRSP